MGAAFTMKATYKFMQYKNTKFQTMTYKIDAPNYNRK